MTTLGKSERREVLRDSSPCPAQDRLAVSAGEGLPAARPSPQDSPDTRVRFPYASANPRTIPLAIDLFCRLGGWAEGFLAEGYSVIGFDNGECGKNLLRQYPGQLVIQDVCSLHGRQFRKATVIVASPPCQAYSYRAMPWKRAKALPSPSNELFDACFRIQREASEAAGRYIPMVVENVKGAQPYIGRAKWHYGSYYLWGDVPALMPFAIGRSTKLPAGNATSRPWRERPIQRLCDGIKGVEQHGPGELWFDKEIAKFGSRSEARKYASAVIAKIPFPLAQHIARIFKQGANP